MGNPTKAYLTHDASVVQSGASAVVESTTLWNSQLCRICHQVGTVAHFHRIPKGPTVGSAKHEQDTCR